jgi:hypothetical protein
MADIPRRDETDRAVFAFRKPCCERAPRRSGAVNRIASARAHGGPTACEAEMKTGAMILVAAGLAMSGPALAGDGLDRHGLEHYRDHHWWGAFAAPPVDGEPPVAEFYAHYIPRGVLHNAPPPAVLRSAGRNVIRAKY